MKIECLVTRDGGSHVELHGKNYHFAPQADGCHVAEVTDEAHQDRFLAIEGYKLYRGGSKAAAVPEKKQEVAAPTEALLGSSIHISSFDIAGKTYALGEVVAAAFARSELSAKEWNALDEEVRHDLIDNELSLLKSGEAIAEAPAAIKEADERAALAAQYEALFGKKPHSRMKIETMKASIANGAA